MSSPSNVSSAMARRRPWLAVARDVNGAIVDARNFRTRWGARRYVRQMGPAWEPIPGRPLYTWSVTRGLIL